jgi:hypothetical protein
VNDLAAAAGFTLFDYQAEAPSHAIGSEGQERLCLYYKTGAGKSVTALLCARLWGQDAAVVIAPPSTHPAWKEAGRRWGVTVECISHAKFRMADTVLSRHRMVIADEMHLFGGQGGKGWKKLDRLAKGLLAPLILASATPNYNDAERCYCIQHVLDPLSCKGGFLQFIYQNCETEQNPFGQMPKVTGFLHYADAAEYLSSLPGVAYLPDDLVYTIDDVELYAPPSAVMLRYGYNEQKHRMIASQIEERHTRIQQGLISDTGQLDMGAWDLIEPILEKAKSPVLVFANHSTVAESLARRLILNDVEHRLVTGKTPSKVKDTYIAEFNAGLVDVLVGTASLATGTDGMDKVCDTLIILDDTDDDSLRRQLIGRIMPRGEGGDASTKQVYRVTLTP